LFALCYDFVLLEVKVGLYNLVVSGRNKYTLSMFFFFRKVQGLGLNDIRTFSAVGNRHKECTFVAITFSSTEGQLD